MEFLGERPTWTDPTTGKGYLGMDAWVAAFKYKREQITSARCPDTTQPTASR